MIDSIQIAFYIYYITNRSGNVKLKLKIKPLSPKIGREIPIPYYATAGAAALDLHACIDKPVEIPGGGQVIIPTGLAVAILENQIGRAHV